jgi:hypothetical protein
MFDCNRASGVGCWASSGRAMKKTRSKAKIVLRIDKPFRIHEGHEVDRRVVKRFHGHRVFEFESNQPHKLKPGEQALPQPVH